MSAATMMEVHLQRNPAAGSTVGGSPVASRPSRAQRGARQRIVAQASSSRLHAVAAPTLNGAPPSQNGAIHLEEWSPATWKKFEARQQPTYPDQVTLMGCDRQSCPIRDRAPPFPRSPPHSPCAETGEHLVCELVPGAQETFQRAVSTVRRMPPLVFAGECRTLQERLAQCAAGNAFMLQVRFCGTLRTCQTSGWSCAISAPLFVPVSSSNGPVGPDCHQGQGAELLRT